MQDTVLPEAKLYKDRNLHLIFGVTLMAVLGVSSITPSFPRIVEELGISKTDVGMLITVFTLPGVFLSPFMGVLADRFGRKRILVPSLFLFGLAGGACALTREFHTLLALRALQGVGVASLSALFATLIGDLFSGERMAAAMGLNSSVLSTGATTFPLIGGALATFGWNYPFLLPLAAIPLGFLILWYMHNTKPRRGSSLREYLASTWSYLKSIRAASAYIAGVIAFTLSYGAKFTYFSLYLGTRFNASPFVIGGIISSMSISTALVATQLGRLVRIISVANLVKLGFALCAVPLLLIPFVQRLEMMLILTIVYGAGWAIIVPCIQIYISGLAPSEYRAILMSINSTMFRLGQTLGPLIVGLAYTYGDFKGAFLFAGGLALITAIVGFIGGRIIR